MQTESQTEISSNGVLRLGIIGFGHIGRHHLRATLNNPRATVTAIADPSDLDRSTIPDSVTVYREWEELIKHPELDAVSVCVPHHMHAPITLAALAAGKHVLVEKPLALTVEEGRLLIESAQKHNRTIMVELTHRFYPAARAAQELVRGGLLGEIFAVEDRVIEPAGAQIQPWLKTKALAGGGAGLTNGVHMVDRVAAITGQALAFESGRAGYSGGLGDVEDTAALLLTLENGAPVQMLSSWPTGTWHASCGHGTGVDDELSIYGTLGTLRMWAWRGWRFEPLTGEPAREHICHPDDEPMTDRIQSGVAAALEEFVAAVSEGREPVPSAADALAAQELIEQFYRYVAK
jgi:UDP-N-acetylglucosamine 3-dehydrogenase